MNALWWWIDRWRKSSAYMDMTLEQQGAYRNLLDEATLRGGAIPNDENVLAKACGDARAWRRLRAPLLARFELRADGWHNVTLDGVIVRSEELRTARAESGRLGGLTKAANAASNPSKRASKLPSKTPSKPLANEVANELAKSYLLSPSPDQEQQHTHTAREGLQGSGAFEPGSLPRDHVSHALCGPAYRACLSPRVYGKLGAKYGGSDQGATRTALETFLAALEQEHDAIGDYLWLEGQFVAWLRLIGRLKDAPTRTKSPSIADEIDAWAKS